MTGEVWAITSWGRRRAHRLGPVARTESALSVTTTAGELLAMSTFKRSLLRVRGLVVAAAIVSFMVAPANAQPSDYAIGARDGLTVTVLNQADLGGAYDVEADGTLLFPLVGRVRAGGLTIREFEAELTRLLADGFFKRPQVSVVVEAHRSGRIFVVGEVRNPGTYPLTAGMTLIEAVATAGSTTAAASNEALIVRAQGDTSEGPTLPGQKQAATVLSVDVEALQSGDGARNLELHDGDTIFVPGADTVYIFGEVRAPGEYPIRKTTTVLQALALAGGVTDFGATNRVRVIRVVDDEQQEIRVKLNHIVQPGDTLVVPQRFF